MRCFSSEQYPRVVRRTISGVQSLRARRDPTECHDRGSEWLLCAPRVVVDQLASFGNISVWRSAASRRIGATTSRSIRLGVRKGMDRV
jgi:hypothetical protein